MKKTIKNIDLTNKKVIMRVDFNVPLKEGVIGDDTRIKSALPSIKYILEQKGTSLILMSHLGRPKGNKVPELSLAPIAKHLEKLLGTPVKMLSDSIGEDITNKCKSLKTGEIAILENLRFYEGETSKIDSTRNDFAKQLGQLADIYVNDAFGTAHREHASTATITQYMDISVAGFLIEKEIKFFEKILTAPDKPFIAIVGGAKVSSKISVLEKLLEKVDKLIIGGAMAFTFLKALNKKTGKSMVEDDYVDVAKTIMKKAKEKNVEFLLPIDHLGAKEFSSDTTPIKIDSQDVPDDLMGLDVGEKSIKKYEEVLKSAKTVLWNGPLGVFEFSAFAKGTESIARMIANSNCISIIGGGDSVAAVNKFNLGDKMSHVSTGGGASLEYMEGKTLPGIAALDDK